jgi:DNA-binding CsgD family transcriptional regulator
MAFTLGSREQSAIRRFLMAEPEAHKLLPQPAVDALIQLIGCDRFGVCEADKTGYAFRRFALPDVLGGPQVCDGPLHTGLIHLAQTADRTRNDFPGIEDFMWSGFATTAGTVVQVGFDRCRGTFNERDVALLTMVEPALGRLMRARPRLGGHEALTSSERRVLALVAEGASNREAAECLYITVATIRKHLEHAYRKLGVTNRTAAVMALQPTP